MTDPRSGRYRGRRRSDDPVPSKREVDNFRKRLNRMVNSNQVPMTMAHLAKLTEYSKSHISLVANGKRQPSQSFIDAVNEAVSAISWPPEDFPVRRRGQMP